MKSFYTLLFIFLTNVVLAQIQGNGGRPTSTKLSIDQKSIIRWDYPQPNVTALQAEDEQIDDK